MNHLDLFSGIGGFALAAQTVWGSDYHCIGFCEIDKFCQQVLSKNFPGVKIYGDIRGLTAERLAADAESRRYEGCHEVDAALGGEQALYGTRGCGERTFANTDIRESQSGIVTEPDEAKGLECCTDGTSSWNRIDLLTGGFPCQPFSTAGKRKGTEDDRFLWPEMRRVVSETRPHWIVAENVPGIINMALEQVCVDLEDLGYEVQPIIVPACAVNAPHRRDRVWIVARRVDTDTECLDGGAVGQGNDQPKRATVGQSAKDGDCNASNPPGEHGEWAESIGSGCRQSEVPTGNGDCPSSDTRTFPDWSRDWREVAFESCVRGVDDGVSRRVARLPDGSTITESRLRQNSLKAYGNAIVPQVAMEIMRAIKAVDEQPIELKEWNA